MLLRSRKHSLQYSKSTLLLKNPVRLHVSSGHEFFVSSPVLRSAQTLYFRFSAFLVLKVLYRFLVKSVPRALVEAQKAQLCPLHTSASDQYASKLAHAAWQSQSALCLSKPTSDLRVILPAFAVL